MNFFHLMILLLTIAGAACLAGSPEEVAEYEVDEAVAEDEQLENMSQNRFEGHVDVWSW